MANIQLCTFRVADLQFGVDVLHVQEVIRFQELTHVPLAPPSVMGLINLRGQIVTAIDMRRRLGLAPSTVDEPPMNVVLRQGDSIVSMLVDAIGDVLEVDDSHFDVAPETLDNLTRSVISAICKLDDGLLLVLDSTAVTVKHLHEAA